MKVVLFRNLHVTSIYSLYMKSVWDMRYRKWLEENLFLSKFIRQNSFVFLCEAFITDRHNVLNKFVYEVS